MYVYCILFVPLRSHVSASLYVVVNLLALQDTNINETTVFCAADRQRAVQ